MTCLHDAPGGSGVSFRPNFVQPLNFSLPFLSFPYPTLPLPSLSTIPASPFPLPFPPTVFLFLSFSSHPFPVPFPTSPFFFLPTHSPFLPPSSSPLFIPYLPFNSLLLLSPLLLSLLSLPDPTHSLLPLSFPSFCCHFLRC